MGSRPPSRGQPELKPVIAEVLRTRLHPPSLLLRVERIIEDIATSNQANGGNGSLSLQCPSPGTARKSRRLILGDGELIIQAALRPFLHTLFERQDISEGTLLEIRKFRIARAKRTNGMGDVVYVGIEDVKVVAPTSQHSSEVEIGVEGGFIREEENACGEPIAKKRKPSKEVKEPAREDPMSHADAMHFIPSSQESDGFEAVFADRGTVTQRRKTLKELGSINRLPQEGGTDFTKSGKRRKLKEDDVATQVALPQAGPNGQGSVKPEVQPSSKAPPQTQTPPPLHDLASLISPATPLPSRNYACSIFAVISWLSNSLIHKPNSPFPAKRHLKIHDPSIASRRSGITLAVYVDAKKFLPRVGTVALFRGLTMQRWEGEVILNAYATLKGAGEDWYVDDQGRLKAMGFDVDGMKTWWEERKSRKGKPAG